MKVVVVADESVHNQVSGTVQGNVVQARSIGTVNLWGSKAEAFELDGYLRAVLRAGEEQPVMSRAGLSTASVSLGDVYVDQALEQTISGRPRTWRDTLAAHRDLIIIGSPGGGKSSLLRRIAYTLADDQLHGDPPDCMPVRVHARSFRSGLPVAEAIRAGAVAELGHFLLADLPGTLFAKAAPGGRPWLVLVDGLDEVPGVDALHTALQTITEGARHPFLRFVVATRPLQQNDFDAARNRFASCELLPFDLITLPRFARRWLEHHHAPNPLELADRLVDHVQRMEIRDWAVQPLAATMLCELLTDDPERRLPDRLSDLYEQYVRKLFTGRGYTNVERKSNRDIVVLLERVAAARQFSEAESPVLTVAKGLIRGTSLESSAADPKIRARELHDLLCRTGFVVSAAEGVEFTHATLEEYFAARRVADRLTGLSDVDQKRTINQVVNAYCTQHWAGQFYGYSQLPVFLIDIWETRGKDVDALLAHLVRWRPVHSGFLVRRLRNAGMVIGPQAVTALATATDNADLELREQWTVASTLLDLGHPEGIARLLGMAADMYLPDRDRIRALGKASYSSPAAAAAASFLVRRHDFPDWDFLTSAIDVSGALLDVADFAVLEGLSLVARSRWLTEGTRLHAAAAAAISGDQSMYRMVAQDRFCDLREAIGDEINNGTSEVSTLLWFMVNDPGLAPDRRFAAAEELSVLHDIRDAAFRALARDLDLDERYRRRAAAALARDGEAVPPGAE